MLTLTFSELINKKIINKKKKKKKKKIKKKKKKKNLYCFTNKKSFICKKFNYINKNKRK